MADYDDLYHQGVDGGEGEEGGAGEGGGGGGGEHHEQYGGHGNGSNDYGGGGPNDYGPPFKRYRRDDNVDPTNPDPSIVVHVRNLSPKAAEADLLEALSHFGPISYATCMPNKRMALVEFETLDGARACVMYASTNQIYVAGQPALFNYSTSKMIQRLGLESEIPNHVLILTIYNAQYPVTVDVIHEICNPHGDVKRIAIIRRSMLQALVEYESAEVAKKAKHAMNGADIYSGCCTLKVEFAKPDHVKVTRQDQDQRDYTLGPGELPSGGDESHSYGGRRPLIGDSNGPHRGGGPPPYANRGGYDGPPGGGYRGRGGFHDRGGFRGRGRGRGGWRGGFGGGHGGDYGPPGGGHYDSYGGGGGGGYDSYGPPGGDSDYYGGGGGGGGGGYDSYGGGGGGPRPAPWAREGAVVMVYGIEPGKLNCDMLFNVMCQYGNVERIKFMKSKPDTAMVEMGAAREVQTAMEHLQGARIFGQTLALKPSKQPELHDIRDPFDLADGSPSFRDYSASRNQRFSTPELVHRNRIVRPTNIVHWYNAPVNMTEDRLKELFAERQAPVPISVTIFQSRSERSSSGVVEFATVEDANAAIALANHTPVLSPTGRAPYIVKLAYAGSRDNTSWGPGGGGGFRGGFRGGRGGPPGGYRGGHGGPPPPGGACPPPPQAGGGDDYDAANSAGQGEYEDYE